LKCIVLQESFFSFLQDVNERPQRLTQGETAFHIHVVRLKLNLCSFPDGPVRAPGFFMRILVSCRRIRCPMHCLFLAVGFVVMDTDLICSHCPIQKSIFILLFLAVNTSLLTSERIPIAHFHSCIVFLFLLVTSSNLYSWRATLYTLQNVHPL